MRRLLLVGLLAGCDSAPDPDPGPTAEELFAACMSVSECDLSECSEEHTALDAHNEIEPVDPESEEWQAWSEQEGPLVDAVEECDAACTASEPEPGDPVACMDDEMLASTMKCAVALGLAQAHAPMDGMTEYCETAYGS